MIRALVLYNDDADAVPDSATCANAAEDEARAARADVVDVAHAVADELVSSGACVQLSPVRHVAHVVRAVRQFSAHVVVNLCESLAADARYESGVAAVLERMGVAFTGASARALRLCVDKQACNDALVRAGVPTPASVSARRASDVPAPWAFPLIVKPNGEDGSTGIGAHSLVTTREELGVEIERVRRSFGSDAIVQQYIDGRELNVSLLGIAPMRVLPIAEIDFAEMPADLPRIVSYAGKWVPTSEEWRGTRVVDADLDPVTARRVAHLARLVAVALELTGYARIDLRLDASGRPFVVDVNPNCDLAPNAGLARAALRGGLSFAELIGAIVDAALARHQVDDRSPTRLAATARAVSAFRRPRMALEETKR